MLQKLDIMLHIYEYNLLGRKREEEATAGFYSSSLSTSAEAGAGAGRLDDATERLADDDSRMRWASSAASIHSE
jgi:hypothetical protein